MPQSPQIKGEAADLNERLRFIAHKVVLMSLEVPPRLADNTVGSGLGPRYLAKTNALSVGLSNTYFKSLGLPTLFEECQRNRLDPPGADPYAR